MTTAKAFRLIVHYLDTVEGLSDSLHQAKNVLEDLLSDYPGKKWDDRSICAAVESFIADHGRPPTTKELDALPELPSHRCVELEFDMKAAQWLRENYPSKDQLWYKYRDEDHTPEEYRAVFVSEYNRTHPHSCLEYNRKRDPRYPSWQHTAKMLGCRLWSELIHICRDELDTGKSCERSFTVESSIQLICGPLHDQQVYQIR